MYAQLEMYDLVHRTHPALPELSDNAVGTYIVRRLEHK
jgi:hypothetical protein